MTWLAYPTMAVYEVFRSITRTRKPLYVVRRLSVHFGTTAALRDAATWRAKGCRMVFVAGSKRALLPDVARWKR